MTLSLTQDWHVRTVARAIFGSWRQTASSVQSGMHAKMRAAALLVAVQQSTMLSAVLHAWYHDFSEERKRREVSLISERVAQHVLRREEQLELVTTQARAALQTLKLGVTLQRIMGAWCGVIANSKVKHRAGMLLHVRASRTLQEQVLLAWRGDAVFAKLTSIASARASATVEEILRSDLTAAILHEWRATLPEGSRKVGSPVHEPSKPESPGAGAALDRSATSLEVLKMWLVVHGVIRCWRKALATKKLDEDSLQEKHSSVAMHLSVVATTRAAATIDAIKRGGLMPSDQTSKVPSPCRNLAMRREQQLEWITSKALESAQTALQSANAHGVLQAWHSAASKPGLPGTSSRNAPAEQAVLAKAAAILERRRLKDLKSLSIKGWREFIAKRRARERAARDLEEEARSAMMLWAWSYRLRTTALRARATAKKRTVASPRRDACSPAPVAASADSLSGAAKATAGQAPAAALAAAVDGVYDQALGTCVMSLWRVAVVLGRGEKKANLSTDNTVPSTPRC